MTFFSDYKMLHCGPSDKARPAAFRRHTQSENRSRADRDRTPKIRRPIAKNIQMVGRSAMLQNAIAAMALAVALAMSAPGARAFDETKYPDWSGQWSRVPDGGPPRYDTTKPLRAQQAPMKPDYRTLHEASMADQDAGGLGLDTAYRCIPQGMPRQMSGVSPMEFIISPQVTHVLFEVMSITTRRIYSDGRDWPKDVEPTFAGYSIGHWIDTKSSGRYDTLEIETRYLRGPRTWDQSGMPTADDNEGVIKERLYLDQANPDILHNEMTTMDNSLTRPWSAIKHYRRLQNVIWAEDSCSEGNPHIFIGKEVYFISADGALMPVKKGQRPPDLKYFNQTKK
jgi:hypothetical protein